MATRVHARAYVQPKGTRHYREPAQLHYGTNRELTAQLTAYARTKWPTAKRVEIDLNTKEVLVNGRAVANFAIYFPTDKEYEPADAVVPL